MPQPIAIAVIHGIGPGDKDYDRWSRHRNERDPDFLASLRSALTAACGRRGWSEAQVADRLHLRPVYWAPVLERAQNELWRNVHGGRDLWDRWELLLQKGELDWTFLRWVMVSFLSDAIAYQAPSPEALAMAGDRREELLAGYNAYQAIHGVFAQTLGQLATSAGDRAPLAMVAHSLGTIVAANYLYDLQAQFQGAIGDAAMGRGVRRLMGDTALERGETLSLLYTLGSPLALWSLRYYGFGKAPELPPPGLAQHYPGLEARWINAYDDDDIIAFPLKSVNDAYRVAVTEDWRVNVGPPFVRQTPFCHNYYWSDATVADRLAGDLIGLWQRVNGAD